MAARKTTEPSEPVDVQPDDDSKLGAMEAEADEQARQQAWESRLKRVEPNG